MARHSLFRRQISRVQTTRIIRIQYARTHLLFSSSVNHSRNSSTIFCNLISYKINVREKGKHEKSVQGQEMARENKMVTKELYSKQTPIHTVGEKLRTRYSLLDIFAHISENIY